MCTRSNRASVPESTRALARSLLEVVTAVVAVIVALITAPVRALHGRWYPNVPSPGRPATTSHVDVQVHLRDQKMVADIERACRAALGRAARTWAPYPLPVNRIEVLASAPPLGKADIYPDWWTAGPGENASAHALVVVSLGTVAEQRSLTPDEIAGALVAQVDLLVAERYRRDHPSTDPIAVGDRHPSALASAAEMPNPRRLVGSSNLAPAADNVTDLSSVRQMLADMKRSQPLVPADSSRNGVHPEPSQA